MDDDYPDTQDPIVMAVAAICYIGLDGEDHWQDELVLIEVVFAFLADEEQGSPDEKLLPELGGILKRRPVDREELEAWFRKAYQWA